MPIYEYKCRQCERVFEKLIRTKSQIDHISCEACGCNNVVKLVSSFAFSGADKSSDAGNSDTSCNSCAHQQCSSCK